MKIVLIAHYYPPHVGGLEVVVRQQAEALFKKGHEVTVLTSSVDGAPKGERLENGVRVVRMRSLDWFDARFGIPFPIPLRLRGFFQETRNADLVHVHDVFYVTSWLGYLAALWHKKPVFLTQHVALVSHPSSVVMFVQRSVYATFGNLLVRGSRSIVAYNKIVRDFLSEKGYEKKIVEMRNGIDVQRFAPASDDEKRKLRVRFNLPQDALVVLFVGRLVPKKGFDLLLEAAAGAYELVFVGPGDAPEKYRNSLHVHFLGSLDQDSLAQVYKTSDIFILPAKGELFTLAMQEAMASGLPVITTDEPAYASYDLDSDMVALVPRNAASIRKVLESIAEDKNLRARMSAYSFAYAKEHFDKDANIEPLLEAYSRTLRVSITTSWDDGHQLDLQLADLLARYGIRGTFYISPKDREIPHALRLSDEQIRALSERFEIGAHTLTHPHLTKVSEVEARNEIIFSKQYLEQVIGSPVKSFCYPAGYYDARHPLMLREAGYALGRTVERFATETQSRDPYVMPTTLHAYRHWSDAWDILKTVGLRHFVRCYLHWDELAIRMFDQVEKNGGLFHLWGHSWEIEKNGDWARLERVLKHIAGRPNAGYVVNGELL